MNNKDFPAQASGLEQPDASVTRDQSQRIAQLTRQNEELWNAKLYVQNRMTIAEERLQLLENSRGVKLIRFTKKCIDRLLPGRTGRRKFFKGLYFFLLGIARSFFKALQWCLAGSRKVIRKLKTLRYRMLPGFDVYLSRRTEKTIPEKLRLEFPSAKFRFQNPEKTDSTGLSACIPRMTRDNRIIIMGTHPSPDPDDLSEIVRFAQKHPAGLVLRYRYASSGTFLLGGRKKYFKKLPVLGTPHPECPSGFSGYTVSIITNFHKEGELARATLENLERMVKNGSGSSSWEKTETIAILDRPDEATLKIVEEKRTLFTAVHTVDYGDLARSRNFGISQATGDFVYLTDADDLASDDCLLALHDVVKAHYLAGKDRLESPDPAHHVAVYHKWLVEFPFLYFQEYSDSGPHLVRNHGFCHCYTSRILAPRSLLRKYPFNENRHPFGYEDWDLNNRLLAAGVQYKVAEYTLYYRRNPGTGNLQQHLARKNIVRYSDIYAIPVTPESSNSTVRGDEVFAASETEWVERTSSHFDFSPHISFLESCGIRELSIKDPEPHTFDHLAGTVMPQRQCFDLLVNAMEGAEVVMFVPRVDVGGADTLILNHDTILQARNVSTRIMTTLQKGKRFSSLKNPAFDLFDTLPDWSWLQEDERISILLKAVQRVKPKVLHIINSELAIRMVELYGEVIKSQGTRILISYFCLDFNWATSQFSGFPVLYPSTLGIADMILSDNNYWKPVYDRLLGRNVPYTKLHSPVQVEGFRKVQPTRHRKILWASRICNQKNIKVLLEICRKLQSCSFTMYGTSPDQEPAMTHFHEMRRLKNVTFMGEYKNYSEVDIQGHDLLLFTSNYEGLALVRLDFLAMNMPVVSSDVGDSSELFGKEYPLLVKDIDNPDEYCRKIEAYYEDSQSLFDRTTAIRGELMQKHNWATFSAEYAEALGIPAEAGHP